MVPAPSRGRRRRPRPRSRSRSRTAAPGFSVAGSVTGGRVLLVVPAPAVPGGCPACWRAPERWTSAALAAAGIAWLVGEWDNPEAGSALVFSWGLVLYAAAPAVALHAGLAVGRDPPAAAAVGAGGGGVRRHRRLQGVLVALLFDPRPAAVVAVPTTSGWSRRPVRARGRRAVGSRLGLVWLAVSVGVVAVHCSAPVPRPASRGPAR